MSAVLQFAKRPTQFGLRKLFVLMAALAVLLGSARNWAHKRHQLLTRPNVYHSATVVPYGCFIVQPPASPPVAAPALLRLFGEQGIATLEIPIEEARFVRLPDPQDCAEVREAQRLFPEAKVEAYPKLRLDR